MKRCPQYPHQSPPHPTTSTRTHERFEHTHDNPKMLNTTLSCSAKTNSSLLAAILDFSSTREVRGPNSRVKSPNLFFKTCTEFVNDQQKSCPVLEKSASSNRVRINGLKCPKLSTLRLSFSVSSSQAIRII